MTFDEAQKIVEEGPYQVVEVAGEDKPWYVKSKYGLDMGRFADKSDAEAHAARLEKVLV